MTTTQTIQWTPERALHHARCYVVGLSTDDPQRVAAVQQRVADKMVELGCCTWHAAHLVTMERYESGELPTAICEHCGGRADLRVGFHHLCAARAARGFPTQQLDIVDGMECPCARCQNAR